MRWTKGLTEQFDEKEKQEKLKKEALLSKIGELTPMVRRLLDELGASLYGKSILFKNYKISFWSLSLKAKKVSRGHAPSHISVELHPGHGDNSWCFRVSNGEVMPSRLYSLYTLGISEKELQDALFKVASHPVI